VSNAQGITKAVFLEELKKRVSFTNAKLIMQTATMKTGLTFDDHIPLKKEDAQALCLELINAGGPGFQVGKSVYTQLNAQ
jgi:hypothetical protein